MDGKYEIVRFDCDELTLDVSVSPNSDSVWLTQKQMASLYGVSVDTISLHIKHIFADFELGDSVVEESSVTASDGKNYRTKLYNLDMVLAVGYRTKSKNAIVFRRWASEVLKQFLLKGYVIDDSRAMVTNENFANLITRVEAIDERLSKLETSNRPNEEKVFFDGEYLDARSFLKDVLSCAEKDIVLVDPYADIRALDYLKAKKDGASVCLIVSSKAKLTQDDVDAFNREYRGLTVSIDDTFHDRFILLDHNDLYHLGASLNYAGKKTFAITRIEERSFIEAVLSRLP